MRAKVLPGAQTVSRVTAVLDLYSPQRPSLSIAEVAEELDLARSTAHRLLAALRLSGYLRQDGRSGRYLVGARVLNLAQAYSAAEDLRAVARPHLDRLFAKTNETVSLHVREGDFRYPVERIETTHPLRVVVALGQRLPLKGAAGRILSMTAAAAVQAGAAVSQGERVPNAFGVAAAIVDAADAIAAAVEVSGPLDRFSPAKAKTFGQAVLACARAISRDLGRV